MAYFNRLFITLMFILFAHFLWAQTVENEDGVWSDFIHELVSELASEDDINNLFNDFSTLLADPLNLNQATKEQLERYPFLSDQQIEQLMNYIARHHPLSSVYELRLVPLFDHRTVYWLLPFVCVKGGEEEMLPSLKSQLRNGKHEVHLRTDLPLNTRKGYLAIEDDEGNNSTRTPYLGESFYSYLKYQFAVKEKIQAGVLLEKDRGEPLFRDRDRAANFVSAHFVLRDYGALRVLAAGHYRTSFGQGLVMNNDFSFGKSSLAATTYKRTQGIRRHASTDEHNFLQGVAATVRVGKGDLTALYSVKPLHGSGNDSLISSIKTDGMFNTEGELAKRNVAFVHAGGLNYLWKNHIFQLGATALYYTFSKPYLPVMQEYNALYFRGSENFNAGISYEARFLGAKFFGESAVSKSGGVATINGLLLNPFRSVNLSLLQRYYSPTYHAFYGKAFGEASQPIGESGFYLNLRYAFHRQWTLTAYTDFYRSLTPRYSVATPSNGYDYLGQLSYMMDRRVEIVGQYRHSTKPTNTLREEEHTYSVVDNRRNRLKLYCRVKWNDQLQSKTNLEAVICGIEGEKKERGGMVSQQLTWAPRKLPFRCDLYAGYFSTSDYWSSVYSTEKSLLYAFSIPRLYGTGIRAALNLMVDMGRHLTLYVKYACTHYTDREQIGTGPETIEGSTRNDLYLLLRAKF